MCGIAGFIDLPSAPDESPALLRRMLSALLHRGPDEQGLYFDERVGLATARLSIIDLAHGTQPMSAGDGRYWLSFNGEIFNYLELRAELEARGARFATHSDTEVLLQALIAWGAGALSRLEGQFGLLFYDRREHRLLAARDRLGERPLFYARAGRGLAFASELKALFALPCIPRELSLERLQRVYHLWTSLPDETCFAGVESLAPGHFGVYEGGRWTTEPYYRLPAGPRAGATLDEAEAVERVREELDRAVRWRLRSDVEVGTYLSGGLDSSITTYLAQAHHEKPVRTFAIGFADPEFDESEHQLALSRHLGTRHHAVTITNDDILRAFPEVVWHAETALFRTAPVPMFFLSRLVEAEGIKVVVTGEGADEAFLGYDLFKETLFRRNFAQYPSNEARLEAVRGMYPYLAQFSAANGASLLRTFAQHLSERTPGLFSHDVRFANGRFAEKALAPSTGAGEPEEALLAALLASDPGFLSRSSLEQAQVLETSTLLAGYLLSSQGDRMSAAHSVEGRSPFLDSGVVELGWGLPFELRLAGGRDEKHILKRAYRDVLPPGIVARAKQPYRAPDAAPFVEAKGVEWLEALLEPASLQRSGLFDAAFLTAFLARVRALPAARISPRESQTLVLIVSTLLLQRQFVDALDLSVYERPLKLVRCVDGREERR